jgi:uncharacterized membrane protein
MMEENARSVAAGKVETGEDVAPAIRRNIAALRARRAEELAAASHEEKLADAITRFSGSMRFVYVHLVLYGSWIIVNLVPGLPHFDETFVVLAMIASVEAIFLSTFVLISQNRAMEVADRRNELDLQINLLSEHELTRIARLLAAIARRLEVAPDEARHVEEVTQDLTPEAVLEEIERSQTQAQGGE